MSAPGFSELHGICAAAISLVTVFAMGLPGAARSARAPGVATCALSALLLCTTVDLAIALLASIGSQAGLLLVRRAESEHGATRGELMGHGLSGTLGATLLGALGLAFALGAAGVADLSTLATALADSSPHRALFARLSLALVIASVASAAAIAPFHLDLDASAHRTGRTEAVLRLVLVRSATLFFLLKLLLVALGPNREHWQAALWSLAVLSLVVGELGALRAITLEAWMRQLAIARSGIVLAAILCVSHRSASAALLALAVDGLGFLALFALTERTPPSPPGSRERPVAALDSYSAGSPGLRIAGLVTLGSLAGMPGTLGMLPRLLALQAALDGGLAILATVLAAAGLASLLGWIRLYRGWPRSARSEGHLDPRPPSGPWTRIGAAIAFVLLAAGLVPASVVDLARTLALPLP